MTVDILVAKNVITLDEVSSKFFYREEFYTSNLFMPNNLLLYTYKEVTTIGGIERRLYKRI